MRAFLKMAIVAFGVGGALAAAPASAQSYEDDGYYDEAYGDEAYDQPYDQAYDGAYGGDAYGGYCDAYGCPEDYYDLPVYTGDYYYGGAWLNGPLYYRDWGGGRQFWIHGGWRSTQYRGGRFGPSLGRSYYRGQRAYNSGYDRGYRGNAYNQQRSYGQSNYGNAYRGNSFGQGFGQGARNGQGRDYNRRDYNQQRSYGGRSAFQPQQNVAPQAQPQQQRSPQNWRGRGDFGRWSAQQQAQPQAQVQPQSQPQARSGNSYPDRSGRVSGGGGRGDGGGRGRDRDR